MGQGQRKYEKAYKVQAVKLAEEIGAGRAAKELGIPVDTLYGRQRRCGRAGWTRALTAAHRRRR